MSPNSDDEDDEKKATVSVVIDEDEEGHKNSDNDHSEITSTTVEEIPQPLEDHNYVGARTVARSSNYFGDNSEPFPVLEGLESYIGSGEQEGSVANQAVPHRVIDSRRIRVRDEHGRIIPAVLSSNPNTPYNPSVRAYREGFPPGVGGVHVPPPRRVNVVTAGQQQLPTVFNRRPLIRQGEYAQGSPTVIRSPANRVIAHSQLDHAYPRYSPVATSNRGVVLSHSAGNLSNAAMIATDPSRAANDNAPAPFLIPSRGTKPIQRSRMSGTVPRSGTAVSREGPQQQQFSSPVMSGYGSSPRKVYQLSARRQLPGGGTPKNEEAPEYISPDMHSYVKVPAEHSVGKNQQQLPSQYTDRSQAPPIMASAVDSSSIVDVVDEEEAQNQKFFMRQNQAIGILPLRDKQQRRISFNEPNQQQEQQVTASTAPQQADAAPKIQQKDVSEDYALMPSSSTATNSGVQQPQIQHQQWWATTSSGTRYRAVDGGSNLPSQVQQRSQPMAVVGSEVGSHLGLPLKIQQQQHGEQHHIQSNAPQQHHDWWPASDSAGRYYRNTVADGGHHSMEQEGGAQRHSVMSGLGSDAPNNTSGSPSLQMQHHHLSPMGRYSMDGGANIHPMQQQVGLDDTSLHGGSTKSMSGDQQHFASNVSSPGGMIVQRSPKSARYRTMESAHSVPSILQRGHRSYPMQLQQYQQMQQQQQPAQQIQQHSESAYRLPLPHELSSPLNIGGKKRGRKSKQFKLLEENEKKMAIAADGAGSTPIATLNPAINITPISASGSSNRHLKKATALQKQQDNGDEWEGEDYTTRCLCDMIHNDEFMIECERCNVWQHGACMGVSQRKVPEVYFCELCNPRPLKYNKQQAAALQQKKLEKLVDTKNSKKKKKSVDVIKRKRGRSVSTPSSAKPSSANMQQHHQTKKTFKNFVEVTENQYSRGVRAFIQQASDFGDPSLLSHFEHGNAYSRQMFVASNVEGLVATYDIAIGAPVIEYSGCFSLANDSFLRDRPYLPKNNFCFKYTGFGEDNAIIIDASRMGSAARFARRSCKPNTVVRHAIQDGRLHVFLVAAENIDFSAESSNECEVRKFNRSLVKSPPLTDSEQKMGSASSAKGTLSPKLLKRASSRLLSNTSTKNASSNGSTTNQEIKFDAEEKPKTREKRKLQDILTNSKVPRRSGGKQPIASLKLLPTPKSSAVKEDPAEEKHKALAEHEVFTSSSTSVETTPKRSARLAEAENNINKQKVASVKREIEDGKNELTPKTRNKFRLPSEDVPSSTVKRSSGRLSVVGKLLDVPKDIVQTEAAKTVNEKPKLSREERKLQDVVATIERFEQREKMKQERKDGGAGSHFLPASSHSSKKAGGSQSATPRLHSEKKRSLRLASTSSMSSISSIASPSSKREAKKSVTVVSPPKRANVSEKDVSPSKKKRAGEHKQLSHVEAAQLLTEMASGIPVADNFLSQDTANLRLQFVRAAEVALKHNARSSNGSDESEFVLMPECKVATTFAQKSGESSKSKAAPESSSEKTEAEEDTAKGDTAVFSAAKNTPTTAEPVPVVSNAPLAPVVTSATSVTTLTNSLLPSHVALLATTQMPNTKAVKRLTIDEYKRRRSTAAASGGAALTTESGGEARQLRSSPTKPSTRTSSFMPNLKDISPSAFIQSPPLILGDQDLSPSAAKALSSTNSTQFSVGQISSSITSNTSSLGIGSINKEVSLDELKRKIYGMKSPTGRDAGDAPSSSSQQKQASASSTSSGNDNKSTAEPVRLSLDERLKQFTLGRTRASGGVPPSGQP